MSTLQFTLQEFISIGTILIFVGGIIWQTKSMNKRFDRLDEKDDQHDRSISDLRERMSIQEERTSTLSEMRQQLTDIWKLLMRGEKK